MMKSRKLRGVFNPVIIVMLMFVVELFAWGTCNVITQALGDSQGCNVFSTNQNTVTNQFMDVDMTTLNITQDFISNNITFSQNQTYYNSLVNTSTSTVTTDSSVFIQGINFVFGGLLGLLNILLSPFTFGLVLSSMGAPSLVVLFVVGLFSIPLLFLVFTLFLGRP